MRGAIAVALALLAQGSGTASAAGLDCTKAQTSVERAICADEGLKREDTEFSKFYFGLLAKLRGANKEALKEETSDKAGVLLADQRKWLKVREDECTAGDPRQQRVCIGDSIKRRRDQLVHEWVGMPGDADLVKAGKLMLGTLTLNVATDKSCPDCGDYTLSYQGKEIASASDDSRVRWGTPPLDVWGRLKRDDGEAALIEAHDGGEMNCVHFLVVWTSQGQGPRWQPLGERCNTSRESTQVSRLLDGFQFVRSASPGVDGEVASWSFASGGSRQQMAHQPKGQERMIDLYNAKEDESAEPLDNKEFYHAVESLPAAERAKFLSSLSGLFQGCDCAGPIDYHLYGLRKSAEVYAMSGCGIYLEGHYVRCSANDALAVWDKASGKFYFAITPDGAENGKRTDAAKTFPSLDGWPTSVRAQLDDWRKSAPWTKAD